jgi:triacylglycerol lipase
VLQDRTLLAFERTHSIYVSDAAGLDWGTALTWDPVVLDAVVEAIQRA